MADYWLQIAVLFIWMCSVEYRLWVQLRLLRLHLEMIKHVR